MTVAELITALQGMPQDEEAVMTGNQWHISSVEISPALESRSHVVMIITNDDDYNPDY